MLHPAQSPGVGFSHSIGFAPVRSGRTTEKPVTTFPPEHEAMHDQAMTSSMKTDRSQNQQHPIKWHRDDRQSHAPVNRCMATPFIRSKPIKREAPLKEPSPHRAKSLMDHPSREGGTKQTSQQTLKRQHKSGPQKKIDSSLPRALSCEKAMRLFSINTQRDTQARPTRLIALQRETCWTTPSTNISSHEVERLPLVPESSDGEAGLRP